ncbi:M61 family metallopeptidase [Flavobacteriaceae bacterium LMO-SS05]
MNKRRLAIFGFSLFFIACSSAKIRSNDDLALNNPIVSIIDLTSVKDDKAPVSINPGRFTEGEVIYRLPKVIPGSYEVSDFGKFIEDFKALDYEGNVLESHKIDTNSWVVLDAKHLDKITYLFNDTYDIERKKDSSPIFSPEGTNISPDNYMLNLHGIIGYFEALKNNAYTLDIIAPSGFKRTSALQSTGNTLSEDGTIMTSRYFAPRYFDITDNPMMYGNFDIESFMVDDIKVELSVYSPNKIHSAKSIKETVFKMMKAQKAYLGNFNTTNHYAIILFLSDGKEDSPRGFGALEHQKSTVTVLREKSSKEYLAKSIVDIVAHEFFHIVTPLGIHSEDVHYFDYNNPTFSKHLWMYEGVTEYFAQHFQVYEGLITDEAFYDTMARKINISKQYDDTMSFTVMSEHIIEDEFAPSFYNVYLKGALIGMCLDILIREGSHGTRSLVSLMKELSVKYGENHPFEDDSIIGEITEMTYPSVGLFFKKHVEGHIPIPYNEFFEKVGLTLTAQRKLKVDDNATDDVVRLRNQWLHSKSNVN